MGIATGAVLLVLGILAAASVIVKKRPEAKDLIEKMATYQGWLGFAAFFWGIWTIVNSVLNLGWLSVAPIWWVTYLATGVLQFGLGMILGYGLINQYALAKLPDEAREKASRPTRSLCPSRSRWVTWASAWASGAWWPTSCLPASSRRRPQLPHGRCT